MEKMFLSVLNMSLTGAFVIAVICLARLPLKKAPKSISYALWAVAGFRLVFPFSIEGMFSLLPFKSAPIPRDIAMQAVPRIDSGITSVDNMVSSVLPAATPTVSMNPLQGLIAIGSCLWLLGIAVMLLYSFTSIISLKRRLRGAVLIDGNLYEADHLKTPFVIGLFRPKIYIPAGLSGEERRYIVLHEQTHIRRHDHTVKMLAYLVLCLHWFNPLAWVAFVLMGADMEMSCDERVLKELGGDIKSAYSLSLVRVAAGHPILNGSPLAFGEGGMKARIKNVLNFKKRPRTIVIAAAALAAVLIAGFAVNKAEQDAPVPLAFVPASGTYYLVNPTEKQKLERLASVTLYDDGRVWLDTPPISSYLLPDCTFSVTEDELLIHAAIAAQAEEGFFGVENGAVIARFTIAGERTLVFQSASVLIFADEGARYVLPAVSAYEPRRWLDHYLDEQLPWSGSAELELPEYPGVTFKWTPEKVTAIGPDGEKDLLQGMPVWNVYLADLTGDGLPELCATASMGSGMIDGRILVHDYAAGKTYDLNDRGYYNYSLLLDNGRLMVTQMRHPEFQGDALATGELAIVGSELTAIGVDRDRTLGHTGEKRAMTLDYVRDIALKYGPDLTMGAFRDFDGVDASGGGSYVLQYFVADGPYLLTVGSTDGETVLYADLTHAAEGGAGESIDIRYYDVDQFITDGTKALLGKPPSDLIALPDFKPENPTGVYDGEVDGKQYGGIFNSAILNQYSDAKDGFLVYAPTIYGVYEEDGYLRAFVTVYYKRYRLSGQTLAERAGGIIPAAITFKQEDRTGGWELEAYTEIGGSPDFPDGAYFGDSLRKLCVLPVSGKDIQGLAQRMLTDYSDYTARSELLRESLIAHLLQYGQTDVSLQKPDGSLERLT